ncbi:MAG: LPS assembly protein LptD [Phycisphaerae bacterium]|nr:LPS assembly protein LptD [Phycisphaerae bacterium]
MFSGRDFGGLQFESPVQPGPLAVRAARAWVWQEVAAPTEQGAGGQTVHRMFLRGDVRVTLGLYEFWAAQAVAWIEPLGDGSSQIALFFDRVSDPRAQAGIAQSGDRLLVTGIMRGEVSLRPDRLERERPENEIFVSEAEGRLGRFLTAAATGIDTPAPDPVLAAPRGPAAVPPGVSQPYEPGSPLAEMTPEEAEARRQRLADAPVEYPPIFAKNGLITFAAGEPTLITGAPEQENVVVITGGVIVQYDDLKTRRSLQISAERAVAFLKPGPLQSLARSSSDTVRGIYLEGNVVATDGRYTLRGPRMYYDVANNRAVVLDAVFNTYDDKLGVPLYVRAASIRQTAANQFRTGRVTLSTSGFFEPQLSLGASSVTLERREVAGRGTQSWVDAQDLTLRAGGLPFFYWPFFSGDPNEMPLRDLRFENSSGSGFAVKSVLDFFALTGIKRPEGLTADLLLDYYVKRGVGLGTELGWDGQGSKGNLLGYVVPDDKGTDVLSSGLRRDREGETRGLLTAEWRSYLDEHWTLFLEGSYISDENFVDAYYRDWARDRREFTNAAYLRYLRENTAFAALIKGQFNDFTPNQYLLESRGYNVDKLPEVGYTRLADDLLAGAAPGLLSWSQEYRYSRMQLNFTEPTASELGFESPLVSNSVLGLRPDESPADALRRRGLNEKDVNRFDTRHELEMPLDAGPIRLTPFATGRFTSYDTRFTAYSPDADERSRVYGAAGVRASTELVRIDDSVESELLDLHRIRHIVEPSLTLWSAGANLEQSDLPVYDDSVESIATGTAVRAGVMQTWQTQRGGEGRWRSVDVLRVRTDVVQSSGDADKESPIGRFYDYRPEYSLLGNFATADVIWQTTDALALTLNTVYDLDLNQPARTTAGGTIHHSDDFWTFAEVRYINALDVTYLDLGARYRITDKYLLSTFVTYDTDIGKVQRVTVLVRREFPAATLGVGIGYNNITDEFSAVFSFEPAGAKGRGLQLRRLTEGEGGSGFGG